MSREDALSEGISQYANAVGQIGSKTLNYRARKPSGSVVSIYTHGEQGAGFWFIWDTDNTDGSPQTSNFLDGKWEAISAHEVGHVLGFSGHSTQGGSQLMYYTSSIYYDINNIDTPQTYDLLQLRLMYLEE